MLTATTAIQTQEVLARTNRLFSFDTTRVHRQRLQQLFVAAGRCLANRCLAMIVGYIRSVRSSPVQSSPANRCWLRQHSDSWFRFPPYFTVWRLWEPSDHGFGDTYFLNWGYTHGLTDSQTLLWYDTHHIETDMFNNSSMLLVFVGEGTCLRSRCLSTIGGYTYKHRLMGAIYEIRCLDGLRCHDIVTCQPIVGFRNSFLGTGR
jgi:hypothetical protein